MTTHARVVIVGGGILGCSLAYHLVREGWSDCVLVEKGELTSGSTWHAAGQVTHSTSSYGLGRMAGYAIDLYRRIEAETGQSVTFHDCGSLRIAYSDDELDWLRYTTSIGAALGHPMEIVGPHAIRELHPFYHLDGVKAALWTPEDGHVDPAGATFALAAGARRGGATIVRHNRVTGIRREPNREWCVVTEQGDYVCEHVVNAGGAYARQIGQWTGLDLPITCMTHHYLVTDTVPEFVDLDRELPVVRDDAKVSGYVRMEQKSGLIGIYEKENANTVWLDGTPWEADGGLFAPDCDRIMPWLENAMERMPVLAELDIKRAVHGAITHPPDGSMLLGPGSGLVNYWCCCGCQIGIGWGPGAGRYLAQWMVHGAAEISMREFDPRRYGDFADREYAVTKAREDYLLRHEVPGPHFNRLADRPVKPSPLHDRLTEAGAVHEEVFGWELHVPAAMLPGVFDALWPAGEDLGIGHYGSFAMNAMRMEKMFKGASELTNEVTLPEADVMRFARLDKPGGFIGRDASRRSAECPNRPWQCACLEVDAGDADCLGGEAILANGERTGAVSSGAWGPSVGASLAFGYVRPEHAAPGTGLEVVVLGEPRAARVLAEARYDPGNSRPGS